MLDFDGKDTIVSIRHKRGPITMGLLWITMVTAFPSVLAGFEWFKLGITLPQVIFCTIVSSLVILLYTVPAAHMAAITGKGYGQLNGQVFGRRTASAINMTLVAMFVGFYGLFALFLTQGLESLFHWHLPIAICAGAIALLMAMNNLFGFSGIANFARFLAAPVLIAWVFYTFGKAVQACPAQVMSQTPEHSIPYALGIISPFIIGFAIWGNESDYWKFGKPRIVNSCLPLAAALFVGEVIFPITGWIVAHNTGITDYAAATNFMSNYSFAAMPVIGALVLFASYFASNDSNMFGSSMALELLTKMRHKKAVTLLAVLGSLTAYLLGVLGAEKSLDAIVSLNCVILPLPTVIVLTDWMISRRFANSAYFAPPSHVSATIALVLGLSVGVITAGVIPGTQAFRVGIPCLQSWIVGLMTYGCLRVREYKRAADFVASLRYSHTEELIAQ